MQTQSKEKSYFIPNKYNRKQRKTMVGCVLIILADISGYPVDGTTGSDLALRDKIPALVDTDFPRFEHWMLESF